MAYKIQYLPVTGPLPGKSFEEQTAAFLSEIGTLAENATGSGSEAIAIAQEAQTAAQAATTTAADAKTTAENAKTTAQAAETTATAAKTAADTATDTAADAKSAATAAETQSEAALSAAQAAQTTAEAATTTANAASTAATSATTTANNTASEFTAFKNTAGVAGGLATLNADGKVVQTAVRADTAATAENISLSAPLPLPSGGTGRTDGHAQGLGEHPWVDAGAENYSTIPVFDDGADPKPIKWASASGLIDKALSSPLSVEKGGTGNAEGKAKSLVINQTDQGLPPAVGVTGTWVYNTQNPAHNVPDGGWVTSLLTLHQPTVDGQNDATAQLFFGEGNRAWLRTSAANAPITNASPWIPMLTAINGLSASAFSTVQVFNVSSGNSVTLPAGGSWFYFGFEKISTDMQEVTHLGDAFAGVEAGGGTINPSSPDTAMSGFYFKIA